MAYTQRSSLGTPRLSGQRRGFKRPGTLKPTGTNENGEASTPQNDKKQALEKRLSEGFYPKARGRTAMEIYEDKLKAELGDAYEPPQKRRKYAFDENGNPLPVEDDAVMSGESSDGGGQPRAGGGSAKNGGAPQDLPPALLKSLQKKQAEVEAAAEAAKAKEEGGDSDDSGSGSDDDSSSSSEESLDPEGNPYPKIPRLPVSEMGYVYFEGKVLRHEGTRHMHKGLVIVHLGSKCAQMYDRSGRVFGARPEGYLIRNDLDRLKMGDEVKVAGKTVRLGSAIEENEYLHGSFFLRKNQRRREIEKQRRRAEEKQLRILARGKENHLAHTGQGITYGTTMVSSGASLGAMFKPKQFRFYKAKVGYTIQSNKVEKEKPQPTMTFHDPDREKAVVLFRAEYKIDSARRNIYSVVVDPVVGDKLRPHQIVGVQFLWDCVTGVRVPGYHGCILADEMGLGKSLQAITLLWTALNQGKYGERLAKKAVVVAPSSLVQNWCNEFTKWLGEEAIVPCAIAQSTVRGDRILNTFINDPKRNVLVISYDQLRKYENRFKEMTCVGLVICDEGHRLKNAEIKTTKAVDMIPTTRRVILSGTPLQNDLGEFHAMVNFCNPGVVGNLTTFKTVFETPIMRGREPTCPEAEKMLGSHRAYYLATLTNNFILQRKQTINEKYLPSKIEQTVFVRPTTFQKKIYEAIVDNKHLLDGGGGDEGGRKTSPALVAITYLKKLCNHPDLIFEILGQEGKSKSPGMKKLRAVYPRGYKLHASQPDVSGKMDFVQGLFTELKAMPVRDRDKVVIVSNYTQTLDVIAALCKHMGVGYFQLDGSTPIKKRQDLVDQFNVAGSPEIAFLLSSKAGGVGLNLVGANRLILYDPDWNPANDAQAMGRVWRDGQRKKVFIYRLLSTGTIEEKVYQRQVSKQGLSANVMDATDKSKQHFTNNDLKALFTFKGDTVCETHDLLQCRCKQPKDTAKDGLFKPFKTHQRSGPRMDELKGWQHLASADEGNDEVLKRFASMVSFIFANERESQTVKPGVETSKTFAADAPAVHCSQTAADESSEEISVSSDEEESGSESDSL